MIHHIPQWAYIRVVFFSSRGSLLTRRPTCRVGRVPQKMDVNIKPSKLSEKHCETPRENFLIF
jgi:hypothetical protein